MKTEKKIILPLGKVVKKIATLKKKKYPYTLKRINGRCTYVDCEAAGIGQEFLNGDIDALIVDIPHLIISEKAYLKRQNEVLRFWLSAKEKKRIERTSIKKGFPTIFAYLRYLALGA